MRHQSPFLAECGLAECGLPARQSLFHILAVGSDKAAGNQARTQPKRRRITVAIRVAINGFGRIGRLTFRNLMERSSEFEVVGINDLTDNKMLAHLLKYDSTHRRFNGTVEHDDENLVINGKPIKAMAERNPAELPWGDLGVDVVVESTGIFTGRADGGKPGYDSHLAAGAKRVVLSAPAKGRCRPDLRPWRQRRQAQRGPQVHQQR